MRGLGIYSLVKPLALFTVSFFVLFTAAKVNSRGLKQFGRFIAITLIIVATLLVACTVYCNLAGIGCSSKKSLHKTMMRHFECQKR